MTCERLWSTILTRSFGKVTDADTNGVTPRFWVRWGSVLVGRRFVDVPDCTAQVLVRGSTTTTRTAFETPIRFLGAVRAWNRIRNVAGDTRALVRRSAFDAVGGYPEEHGIWLQKMCFNNRLIRAGWELMPMPDPAYFYRLSTPITEGRDRWTEAAQARALAPYLHDQGSEERAYAAYAAVCIPDLTDPREHYRHLSDVAMSRGEWIVAGELWAEIRRLFPDDPSGFVHGAEALMNAGHLEEAETLAGEAVRRFSEHPRGYVQWGESQVSTTRSAGRCLRRLSHLHGVGREG